MIRFFQICEGTVHFEGQKEAIFRFQSCETMGSQLCPPPTTAYRQNGVGSTLDLRWSCIKNVLRSILLNLIFFANGHSQSNSRSNCVLTGYTRNCVCTKCFHNSLRCSKNVWNHFLETFRKFEEHFCHDNS